MFRNIYTSFVYTLEESPHTQLKANNWVEGVGLRFYGDGFKGEPGSTLSIEDSFGIPA